MNYLDSESLPILELIEDCFPTHKLLLPSDPTDKHRVRQICEIINAGIQPLQSLFVLKVYLIFNGETKTYFVRSYQTYCT